MEQESSSSLSSLRQCRICHEEDDEGSATMEAPCGCSGSLEYAHRGCVQRWCDEKGSTLCEICLKNFEPGYTTPPMKTPVAEMAVTVSEDVFPEMQHENQNMQPVGSSESLMDSADYECSYDANQSAKWCQSLTITFAIMLLVWHLVAVVTIEAADHCAFSLVTVYLLRVAGILLPLYVGMRLIHMIQKGQLQYRLQMLEEQRRIASTVTHSQQQHLVINVD